MTRRGYKGGTARTTLVVKAEAADVALTANDLTSWTGITAHGSFAATINRGYANEEQVLVGAINTSTGALTSVTRGYAGSTAAFHAAGEPIEVTTTYHDPDEANEHINDATLDQHTQYALKANLWVNVADYGAVGNGVADDTAEIQAAIDATPSGGVCYLPAGTYKTSATIDGGGDVIDLRGDGTEGHTTIAPTAAVTGAVLSIKPASQLKRITVSNLAIDMTSADPAAIGVDLDNLDECDFTNVKTRGGAIGFRIGFVSASTFDRCRAYNFTTSGFKSVDLGNGRAVGVDFQRCYSYLTTGATASATAGIDIVDGEDFQFIGCRVLRAPGLAYDLAYGIRASYAVANTNSYLFIVNCEFDGIDGDRVASSNNGAAAYFKNAKGIKVVNSWFSALDAATVGVPKQPGIMIEAGSQQDYVDNWISGTGVRIVGAPDLTIFTSNQFAQAGGDNAFTLAAAAAPTKLWIGPQSYADPTKVASLADLETIANASVPLGLSSPTFITTDSGTGGAGLIRIRNATTGKSKWLRVNSGATGTLEVLSDDRSTLLFSVTNNGAIGVGNGAAATGPVGTVTGKIEVFTAAGVSLGYLPVYNAIT